MNYNLCLTAQKLAPFWGATVIDGLEGMEGNGLGNYDISKIEIRGEKIAAVTRKYRLHTNTDHSLQWMAPLVLDR